MKAICIVSGLEHKEITKKMLALGAGELNYPYQVAIEIISYKVFVHFLFTIKACTSN
jgi:hypothetical protein